MEKKTLIETVRNDKLEMEKEWELLKNEVSGFDSEIAALNAKRSETLNKMTIISGAFKYCESLLAMLEEEDISLVSDNPIDLTEESSVNKKKDKKPLNV